MVLIESSLAVMSSIKNRVSDPASSLLYFSIKYDNRLPGSSKIMWGSFQTQPRLLYVELYLKVGQIITMKLKWSLYSFSCRLRVRFSFSSWSYEQCSVWFFHKHFSILQKCMCQTGCSTWHP